MRTEYRLQFFQDKQEGKTWPDDRENNGNKNPLQRKEVTERRYKNQTEPKK